MPGLVCAAFCHCPSHVPQRGRSFWSNSCCPFLLPMQPTWSHGRQSGFVASAESLMLRYPLCRVSSVYTHLYTRLQLFLSVCTRWSLWGLNQRIAALHSSSDMYVLFPPSPGLSCIAKRGAFPRTSRACGRRSRTT